ncbi:unnamed protein product [Pieris brassicae]|uniref:Uncharacterized protein n=1 Tax=Pieris brassicae TaxID=7116 RepID=A0A9P0XEY8_PIEBR|nr:unnamed protein product [Pieris brassicae]
MAAELGVPPKNLMQWTETDAPLQAVGDRFGNLGVGDGDSSQFSWSDDFSTVSAQKTVFRGSFGPTQISLDSANIFEYFWGET